MKVKVIANKKGLVEVEFDDKNLPNALLAVLSGKGVDAYTYEPHPLLGTYRIRVEDDNAEKQLNAALKEVETEWNGLQKALSTAMGFKPSAKKKPVAKAEKPKKEKAKKEKAEKKAPAKKTKKK